MATVYKVHPKTPQTRKINLLRDALHQGAVMLYPTDTVYAIGCDLTVKSAIDRVRRLKQASNDKPLTFLCSSLSNIAEYAYVSDPAYRQIRHLIPGTYTFILPATKQVPKLVMSPKRKTTGIRVPDCSICLSLIEALGNPIISTSALSLLDLDASPLPTKAELFDVVGPQVDFIIDDDRALTYGLSTILNLEEPLHPTIERRGLGWEHAADLGMEVSEARVLSTH